MVCNPGLLAQGSGLSAQSWRYSLFPVLCALSSALFFLICISYLYVTILNNCCTI